MPDKYNECSKAIIQEGILRWLKSKETVCGSADDGVLRRLMNTFKSAEQLLQQPLSSVEIKQNVIIKNPKIKRVLILYTGGTIGMQENEEGALVPAYKALEERLRCYPELHDQKEHKELIQSGLIKPDDNILVVKNVRDDVTLLYQIYEYQTLLDSSDMSSKDWLKIAADVERFYDSYDGFVILHGTDTLSFTSSALSFILENLKKPVILTGSQRSIFDTHSDAKNNIVNSLIFASMDEIHEVCVCFSNKLMRGNRCIKSSATDLDAFSSPNFPLLGHVRVHIRVYTHMLFKECPSRPSTLKAHKRMETNVNILRMQPLVSLDMIAHFLQPPVKGLVIETYGTGNVPNMPGFMDALQNAIEVHHIIIINVTQCQKGYVGALYPMAQSLEKIGVIAGNDMTPEAALCKLSFVLAKSDWSMDEKIHIMKSNICGEISIPGEHYSIHK